MVLSFFNDEVEKGKLLVKSTENTTSSLFTLYLFQVYLDNMQYKLEHVQTNLDFVETNLETEQTNLDIVKTIFGNCAI